MSYPKLKPEMLQPKEAKISAAHAKKVYRQFMLHIGFLHREEISEHVQYLSDDMKEHEQGLRDDLAHARESFAEEISEIKREVKRLKRDELRESDPELKEELRAERELAEKELSELEQLTSKPEAALQSFREDRRTYLVEYINRQTGN